MKLLVLSLLLLLPKIGNAQVTISLGPQLSGNLSTVHFKQVAYDYPASAYRPGWSAGLAGEVGLRHWALQPAILYEQRGFKSQTLYNNGRETYDNRDDVHLRYLTFPLHVAYRRAPTGQGVQVFAGPYLSLLLNGHYRSTSDNINGGFHTEASAPVSADPHASSAPGLILQRLDAGLEGGIGYRYQHFLLQASYRLGMRDANSEYYGLISFGSTAYRNRACQASLTYLFGDKH